MITNVTNALKDLKDKKQLSPYRYNVMVPKSAVIKLSYMYFNSKEVHKVKMI